MVWVVIALNVCVSLFLALMVLVNYLRMQSLEARLRQLEKIIVGDRENLLRRVQTGIENLRQNKKQEDVNFLAILLFKSIRQGAPDERVARLIKELEPFFNRDNTVFLEFLKGSISYTDCPVGQDPAPPPLA
jgi:hypothetical protein